MPKKDAKESTQEAVPEKVAEKPPEKDYAKEELLPIIDSLLNHGYATMPFKIKDIQVVLKTRFTWEDQLLYKKMKDANAESPLGFRREFTLWSMAASLAQFGNHVFEPMNDPSLGERLAQSLEERYDFLRSLNVMFVDIIENKMFEFDEKQAYIVKNFEKLLADF